MLCSAKKHYLQIKNNMLFYILFGKQLFRKSKHSSNVTFINKILDLDNVTILVKQYI